jgi:hypothetical protein
VQDNTFVIAAPLALDHDPVAGLGVGYDVVLDCDGDGSLGAGDAIDGRGDEAGFHTVHDTTGPGPLAVSQALYSGGTWLDQVVYYPSAIAAMGRLPLVVVSHGWTHSYLWYGHIGQHLASHGYIVMAHGNDVGNGNAAATHTASTTTLTNTDYLIGNQATIEGGVLDGHIDDHRIVWIGHSTGGEGVVRAYTRLRTGDYVPQHYGAGDVVLVSSIAPVSFLPRTLVSPLDVNYHMFVGGADTDVSGAPLPSYTQPISIYERARGNRQLIYVQGAGHADFHDGGGSSWAFGPALIGRAATHTVVRGYYLPLVELYTKGNVAALDFFTRTYEDFHPVGIPAHVVIANEYKDADASGTFTIDDYQGGLAVGTSSSGGAVSSDVEQLAEGLMQDLDGSFAWTGTQPSNGMTRVRFADDDARSAVFDWPPGGPRFYELEVVPAERDFSDREFLSFRACQGTRHPETDALDAPLSFTAALRDGGGVSSAIDFGVYGRITRPYERTGSGPGAGWQNEFGTIRIPVGDFAANGTGIDLTDVTAVRFEFGAGGAPRGRIGLDDVELTPAPPGVPFPLSLSRVGGTTRVTWSASPGALSYNVYRGTVPASGLPSRGSGLEAYDHVCHESGDALGDGLRVSTDPEPIPADLAGFYYLVATVRDAGQGSLGQASVDLDPVAAGEQRERPAGAACP